MDDDTKSATQIEPTSTPTSGNTRSLRARTRVAGSAAAIGSSQAITAGTSLLLQMLAARELGLAGFGAYALCIAFLSTVVALYTGYVGDSLTVMDRHDPMTREALTTSAVIGLTLAFGVAIGLIRAFGLGGFGVALLFAAMVAVWLVEETGRRVLLARLEYWSLVWNDATYAVCTLATVTIALLAGAQITLGLLLAAMLVGCCVAVIVALIQLPSTEWRNLRVGRRGGRAVASFAVWRSLQSTLKPAQLLTVRILVLQIVSLAAVGLVEAGRLIVAPIQTVLNGASAFLLSMGAADRRAGKADYQRNARAAAALVLLTLAGGALAAMLSGPLGQLVAGRSVSSALVLGWTVYLAMWAASLPFTAELTVRMLSWPVFLARLAETVISLGVVTLVLLAGGSAALVPWLMAAAALINTWYLRRLAIHTRAGGGEHRTVAV